MNEMTLTQSWPTDHDRRYHFKQTVTDATSEALRVPAVGSEVAVSVVPGTGAKVQFTLSSYADIDANAAVWHDWPKGEVVEQATDAVSGSVSALRLVSSGESSWEVSA